MNSRSIRISALVGLTFCGTATTSPLRAQAADAATGDIIVTARRTEERLQDVPISITVYNQEQISQRNIVGATDLGTYTPSLSVNQRYGSEKSSFAIRGFVQEPATAPSVGVYFADIVAPRAVGSTTGGNTVVAGSFMDLQNVQVLKGPQGTLFGRNTTGGAVLVVPNKPTGRLEGSLEGSVGDYEMKRALLVLNVPLADTFKVRLAADRNKRSGYMINRSGIGPEDYNDVNYFAARLSMVADLTPDLESYTIATYSNSFSHGYGARIVACNPNVTAASGGAAFTALPACDQIARRNNRGDGLLDVDINNPNPRIKQRHWAVINTTTWRASDALTVKNIASYQEFRSRESFSLNGDNFTSRFPAGLPLPNGIKFVYTLLNPAPGLHNSSQFTFSDELQFQGQTDDLKLKWRAGAYFEKSGPLGFSSGRTGILLSCSDVENLACTNPFGPGQVSHSAVKFWFNSKGLYGQATYELTDRLSLTGGLRYTWDYTRALGQTTRLAPQANGTFVQTCNDVVHFFTGTPGRPLVVSNASQCGYSVSAKSKAPTWLIDIDYKPADDILLYAKYARGYRTGGINLSSIGLEGWKPEKAESFEVGAKTSFQGSSVRGYFNLAGFYNVLSNQQLNVNAISNVAGFAGSQPTINAGKSRIQGIEVDASATLFGSLKFDLGYTYLDTKVIRIDLPPIPAGAPYSALVPSAVEGGPLAYSPKNRVTLTASYALPLPESVGQITLAATFIHTDRQVATLATLPQYRHLPATDLLNLNVNWDNAFGRPVDVSFFMTNVTNRIYPVGVGGSYGSAGFESMLYAAPRMWGFRLRYRFGE